MLSRELFPRRAATADHAAVAAAPAGTEKRASPSASEMNGSRGLAVLFCRSSPGCGRLPPPPLLLLCQCFCACICMLCSVVSWAARDEIDPFYPRGAVCRVLAPDLAALARAHTCRVPARRSHIAAARMLCQTDDYHSTAAAVCALGVRLVALCTRNPRVYNAALLI